MPEVKPPECNVALHNAKNPSSLLHRPPIPYTLISMKTKNLAALAGLTFVASGLMISSAHAQSPRTIYLYNASLGTAPAGALNAKTAPWGNGEIKPTRQLVEYEGAGVLELTTRNFAEGARFDLKPSINIDPYIENGFVRLRLKFAEDTRAATGFPGGAPGEGGFPGAGGFPGQGGGFPGAGGGFPGADGGPRRGGFNNQGAVGLMPQTRVNAQFGAPGALPPFGGAGGFPGAGGGLPGAGGFPGQGGMEGGFPGQVAGPPAQATAISELRITLVRENGIMVGRVPIDLARTTPDAGGWRLFVLPLKEMKQTLGASGLLQRILITSDKEDTFFMAQAALVIETGKMEVSIRPPDSPEGAQMAEITVKPGPITLIADVEAGAADPQVEWNFDADNVGHFPPPTPPGGFPGAATPGGFAGAVPGGGFPGGGFPGGGAPGGFPGATPGGGFPGGGAPGGVVGEGGPIELTGPRVDARGLIATFTYPNEEQNYRVEVKVTDKAGKKDPVTASILVKVRG